MFNQKQGFHYETPKPKRAASSVTVPPAKPTERPTFVAYYRVSTQRQGISGLGLAAQRAAVTEHVTRVGGKLVAEMKEVESGRKAARPQLAAAIAQARAAGAVLVIAKLDRLARNVAFLSKLMNDVDFIALDLPGANRFTLHVMAAVAEQEARRISENTRAALKAAKARGTKLGTPANLTAAARQRGADLRKAETKARYSGTVGKLVTSGRAQRQSFRQIAAVLNDCPDATLPQGGRWSAMQVRRVLEYVTRSA
jgi:DNA invertase Pin-like site-specific DNA recombinase